MGTSSKLLLAALVTVFPFTGTAQAQGCYESSILSPSPFMGNHGEVFRLSDGSIWEVKNEYSYLYEYYPSVTVCPSLRKLILKKKQLSIAPVAPAQAPATNSSAKVVEKPAGEWEVFEETNLEGSINGTVQRGRIFKTVSQNIYEVTGLTLQLVLELQPSVLVLRNGDTYKLIVDGFDEPLICKKLNPSGGSAPRRVTSGCSEVIETQIDGTFNGWTGDTVFKLSNGQIWQQSSYDYTYHYAYRPEVLIFPSSGRCKMKVDAHSAHINDDEWAGCGCPSSGGRLF